MHPNTTTHTGSHSIHLVLVEDTGRVSSLSVEYDIELVSNSALYPAKKNQLLMSTLQR
jgi:hypothetical protein